MSTLFAVGILIVATFFIAKMWMWIYRNAFAIELNKKVIFVSLFVGGIAAAGILLFPHIATYFNLANFTENEYSFKVLLTFLVYINIISLIFIGVLNGFSKKQLINLGILNIYFVVIFYLLGKLDIDGFYLSVIFYYLFVAYGEETIKNQLAFGLTNKIGKLESDLLLYHILVAIGFAFWENIVYLVSAVGFNSFLAVFLGGLSVVVMRGILGFGAHTFYSSLIGMGNILGFLSIFLFVLVSMLVHYGYDLALYFDYKIILPFFILIVYFWISYIFYKIDRLYIN